MAAQSPKTIVELIADKRDGRTLEAEEIQHLVRSFHAGTMADYQMAAFLMATFFRGMDDAETVALTHAMLHSGRVLDLSAVPGFKVDKHSTGGVGDKVSICLAPLVAACGVPVPMVSGRGLGHTGGTLDKLEAIPGFRTDLDVESFARIVGELGTSLIGQTAEVAPADKRMYALRDVTATVECIPLIVASILSKKLAEGIDGLVLDVKVGRGAFMKDLTRAQALARALVSVGTRAGKRVVALLTAMDSPLGVSVGNATETREAIYVLHGKGPSDLLECTFALGAEMLRLAGKAESDAEARSLLRKAIDSGAAARTFERVIEAHHGDPRVVAEPERLEVAPEALVVRASRPGFVTGVDALAVGLASVALGAGRTRADQAVDHAVGIDVLVRPGHAVQEGDALVRVYARSDAQAESIRARLEAAVSLGDAPPESAQLVLERIAAG